ncbi:MULTISPECIES: hypothetical protein [unclassified Streptomyces]|uniref:hypothetical protein n=1 Tax=unclassified Streptomyces TaxID=2593676 RepID=UPI0033929912
MTQPTFAETMPDPIIRTAFIDSLEIDLTGGCGLCDTEAIELCAGCGRCRCDTHESCTRPAA